MEAAPGPFGADVRGVGWEAWAWFRAPSQADHLVVLCS